MEKCWMSMILAKLRSVSSRNNTQKVPISLCEPLKRGVISLPCVINHELRVARVGGGKPPFLTAFFRLESFQ